MSSVALAPRSRLFALALASVLASIALVIAPLAAPANATSSPSSQAASVLTKLNAYRAAQSPALDHLASNPTLTAAAQTYAKTCSTNFADCDSPTSLTCANSVCAIPSGWISDDFGIVKVANGSNVTTRAVAALIAYHGTSDLARWEPADHGAVGFVVSGSFTYVSFLALGYPLGVPIFTVNGTNAVGSQLTVSRSGFTTEPASFDYAWTANNDPVGTDSPSYTPTAADWNRTILVTISWPEQNLGTAQDTEDAGSVALGSFAAPTTLVTGRANVGQTLTASPIGDWQPTPAHLHFVWLRDGVAIPLQTSQTYLIQAGDLGHKIDLTEVAEAGAGTNYATRTVTTHTRTKVAGKTFDLPGVPTIVDETSDIGPFYHDHLLVHLDGTWSPTPSKLSYQWYRNGHKISGATHSTYQPGASDIGEILTVKVTASRSGFVSAAVVSVSSSDERVQGLQFTGFGNPTVTGIFTVGQTLTAHHGTWTPAATSYSYRWERNGLSIKGATHSTYKTTSADLNTNIDIVVTAKRLHYETSVSNSDTHAISAP